MLLSPSLLIQPVSGFVPFADGGTPGGAFDLVSRKSPLVQTAPPVADAEAGTGMRRAVWEPRSSLYVRRVEMLVLVAVCAYFALGLGTLGWL